MVLFMDGLLRDPLIETLYLALADEEGARDRIEARRWPDGRLCAHCGAAETVFDPHLFRTTTGRLRYTCRACGQSFSVRTGWPIDHDNKPLWYWEAVWFLFSESGGLSPDRLAEYIFDGLLLGDASKTWGTTPRCPRCEQDLSLVRDRKPGPYWCSCCREYASFRTNTPFENSKVSSAKLLLAIFVYGMRGGRISSAELARAVGVSRKTARHLLGEP